MSLDVVPLRRRQLGAELGGAPNRFLGRHSASPLPDPVYTLQAQTGVMTNITISNPIDRTISIVVYRAGQCERLRNNNVVIVVTVVAVALVAAVVTYVLPLPTSPGQYGTLC